MKNLNEKYTIKINKNTLYENAPCKDTILTLNHCIFFKGTMIKAKDLLFLNGISGVSKVTNNKEILYNVVLDNSDRMIANNMIVETLNPNHSIAKLYINNSKEQFDEYKINVNDKIKNLWKLKQ